MNDEVSQLVDAIIDLRVTPFKDFFGKYKYLIHEPAEWEKITQLAEIIEKLDDRLLKYGDKI
jgi:hypothetical protein